MMRYHLYALTDGVWVMMTTVEAETHREAFRAAMMALPPRVGDRPIRLEQEISPPRLPELDNPAAT